MGGCGSGRYGGRPTVEDGLILDICRLFRDGSIKRHCLTNRSISWRSHGETIATIGMESKVYEEDYGDLRLFYTVRDRWTDERRQVETRIFLRSTPQPLGGRRWWFVCPVTRRRATKLYLPPGAETFASRHAYRLGYRSQRATPYDRSINLAHKLRWALGDDGAIGDDIEKPKWMRWRTYDRKVERIEAVEDRTASGLLALVQRLEARHPIGRG